MKRFITDDKLIEILARIEKWIRYPVCAAPMPEKMRQSHKAAVALMYGHMWHFLYREVPSQFTLCHELMHIILGIEGWPMLSTPELLRLDRARDTLFDVLINFSQHIVINERMHLLGYKEMDELQQGQGSRPDSNNQGQAQTALPQANSVEVKVHALHAAELLLSPQGLLLDRVDRNTLQEKYPQCWILVDAICRDVEMHRPLGRQSGVALLYSVLETLSEPKEYLRLWLSCIPHCPLFFDHMRVKINQG